MGVAVILLAVSLYTMYEMGFLKLKWNGWEALEIFLVLKDIVVALFADTAIAQSEQ